MQDKITNQLQNEDTVTRHYLIRGRVQGVGFRWFVEREAKSIGLTGWVRNTSDGAMEVLARGTAAQHAELRPRLERGPRGARVESVEESHSDSAEKFKTFHTEGAW